MKTKVIYYTSMLLLVLAFGSLFFSSKSNGSTSEGFSRLVLEVQSDEESYILGEPVALDFRVINGSKAPVFLYEGSDVWQGHLKVLIAYEDEGYKEYRGPRWGLKDVRGMGSIKLAPGDFFETEATILYNHRFETGHLNETSAKGITEKYIGTEYALAKPGKYHIKAILYDSGFVNEIESEPIQISVNEPQGIDLEVWNKFKSDAEYAYFIQTGGPKGHPTSAKTRQIVETLEKIVSSYPGSTYAQSIRPSLSSHYSSLEELKKKGLIKP